MPRVKVCGFANEEDVSAAVSVGVDAVGTIVDVPVETPREVSPSNAASLVGTVPPFVSSVLVTMPDSVDRARELIDIVHPDAIQIHGGLSPSAVGELAEAGITTIASVDHGNPDIEEYATVADAVLVDSSDERGAGGTGRTHDWSVTRDLGGLEAPIILAGGLTPANVDAAVEMVDPYAVDVASGVEIEPGRKDPARLRQFVEAATSAGSTP
ncbi:MAG: phosphoribosylanthranilate isomerase [Halodesulfurarchaeum sp.]|nr:phosphoribosylanthranilate isomerase [Halodesulfurarchaeum sp.]